MVKKSPLNIVLFIFSILAAIAVFGLGELLLGLMDNWLGIPYFLQCAIYLMFAMTMLFLTIFVSEKISSGYYIPRGRVTFSGTCAKAAAIFVPCAFVVGLLTQLLYGVTTIDIGGRGGANFQGTLVVSDISGSMLDNDPDYLSIDALINYVESVPLGEHLGVVLYSSDAYTIRQYSRLNTEAERAEIIEVLRSVTYNGGTQTQTALMEAFRQVRATGQPNWPGLILLLSDGDDPSVNLNALSNASSGNSNNYRNKIPVNTVFFGDVNHPGANQMARIADATGGHYSYMSLADSSSLTGIFSHARSLFTFSAPHLLKSPDSAQTSIVRIILQILLLAVWGVFVGLAVVIFLNNSSLFSSFFIARIIVSVLIAIVFTAVLAFTGMIFAVWAMRFVFALGLCTLFLPTFSWGANASR